MKVRSGTPGGARWVGIVVACSIITVAAAFALGTVVRSPWEAAVNNSQREPVVTVPVEHLALKDDVADARGTYSEGHEIVVAAPQSDMPTIITARKVRRGDKIHSGDVLAEVSGRPVFALSTRFSLYRDLTPGVEGPDVTAVQKALRALGRYRGTIDGQYGAATAAAVRDWYQRAGYTIPIDVSLTQGVDDARQALDDARSAQRQASKTSSRSDATDDDSTTLKSTRRTVVEAQKSLTEAEHAALTPLRVSEVTWIPRAGATVLTSATIGTDLGGGSADVGTSAQDGADGAVRLRVGEPSLTVRVGVASKGAYEVGSKVSVLAVSDQQDEVVGVVSKVSGFRQPDADTASGLPGYDATITFDDAPPFSDGDTLVATPKTDVATKAEGLGVPLVALREDSSGAYVNVAGSGRTPVEVVATGEGYAVVESDALAEGDKIVVSGGSSTGTTAGSGP